MSPCCIARTILTQSDSISTGPGAHCAAKRMASMHALAIVSDASTHEQCQHLLFHCLQQMIHPHWSCTNTLGNIFQICQPLQNHQRQSINQQIMTLSILMSITQAHGTPPPAHYLLTIFLFFSNAQKRIEFEPLNRLHWSNNLSVLKTTSFLETQIGQQSVQVPTKISILRFLSTPSNEPSKIWFIFIRGEILKEI